VKLTDNNIIIKMNQITLSRPGLAGRVAA
jgi:hypothetical protein